MADSTDPNTEPETKDSNSDNDDNIDANHTNRRGSYNKPLRAEAMRQIRKMLVEQSASHLEIMEKLRLPERTFYRYLSELFERDRALITSRLGDDEVINQLVICEQRLLKQRQDILDNIANNAKADWRARVEAHHLCGEICAVVMKLRVDAPSMLAARHKFPDLPALTRPGTKGLKLVLREEENEHDELEEDDCE